MPNYSNAKIYKIVPCDPLEASDVYIGSTTRPLSERMAQHRSQYQTCSSRILFKKYGIDNLKIELIECFPCDNKDELNKREGDHIRSVKCINKNIPGRTSKQYYQDNIVMLTMKKSTRVFCGCGGCYRHDNRIHHYATNKHLTWLIEMDLKEKQIIQDEDKEKVYEELQDLEVDLELIICD